MTRLLIVTTVPSTINAFLMPYVRHFRGLGWQVDGMANGITVDARAKEAFDQVFDIDWSRNPMDPRNFVGRPGRIRAIVEREGYDLVHVHTPVAAFVTRFALAGQPRDWHPPRSAGEGGVGASVQRERSRELSACAQGPHPGPPPRSGEGVQQRAAVVYTAHGFHFHEGGSRVKNALFLALEKLAGRWTDALVVINREDEAAARRHRLLPDERIFYMPGIGVDTEALRPEAVAPADLGWAPLLTMVAEFNPGKRHREALEAFAGLERKDVHLAFAGVGPLEEAMKALAVELGVAERVHFLGWRQDVPAIIRASAALLLPSEREGLPRSVMEAMALGVPVVATDIRGVRDLLGTGGGIMVPVGDVAALGRAIATVLEDPEAAREMGRVGRERVLAFDVRRVVEMHEAVYSKLLSL